MSEIPDRIWLQRGDGPTKYDWTWHWEPIGEEELEEVEYIRADLHDAKMASAREVMKKIRSWGAPYDAKATHSNKVYHVVNGWLEENPE